jgi:hypothetical protein
VKMIHVLFAAVAAGAAVGGVRGLGGTTQPIDPDSTTAAALSPAPNAEQGGSEARAPAAIEGEVLEAIQVPNYSYLRVGARGSEGTWAAVPTTDLAVGDHARVGDALQMQGFTSNALKRTFPVIYFGTLETSAGGAAAANPHAKGAPLRAPAAADPHANAAGPGAAGAGSDAAMKSAHAPLAAVATDVAPVARAQGPSARTVAELIAQRTELAGKTVRIHATVVKSTPGVLGRTYLHVRDGSGDAAAGTHDVTVTTDATPAVGDTVLVEGVVAIDRDIGAGYRFPTIVEDAKIVTP